MRPAPDAISVHVDGHPVEGDELSLTTGPHLLQLVGASTQGLLLDLSPGEPATLVLPGLLGERALANLSDPDHRAILDEALAPLLPPGTRQWAALPEATWVRTPDAGWSLVAEHEVRTRVRGPTNRAIRWTGAALLATGAGVGAAGYLTGNAAWRSGDASQGATWEDYEAAEPRWRTGRAMLIAGEATAAIGAAGLVVGLTLPLDRVEGAP